MSDHQPTAHALYQREWRTKNPEKIRAYAAKHRDANRAALNEKSLRYYRANKDAARKRVDAWKLANPEKCRASTAAANLRAKYGITVADKDRMVQEQDGRCAICTHTFKDTRDTCVDHCHITGTVRGILCRLCNLGLGKFRDDRHRLHAAIEYLERHRGAR